MRLTAPQQREMGARIAQWRVNPAAPMECPACGRPGLAVVDRSARPHAEWYALSCATCGLTETLHIALGTAIQPPD